MSLTPLLEGSATRKAMNYEVAALRDPSAGPEQYPALLEREPTPDTVRLPPGERILETTLLNWTAGTDRLGGRLIDADRGKEDRDGPTTACGSCIPGHVDTVEQLSKTVRASHRYRLCGEAGDLADRDARSTDASGAIGRAPAARKDDGEICAELDHLCVAVRTGGRAVVGAVSASAAVRRPGRCRAARPARAGPVGRMGLDMEAEPQSSGVCQAIEPGCGTVHEHDQARVGTRTKASLHRGPQLGLDTLGIGVVPPASDEEAEAWAVGDAHATTALLSGGPDEPARRCRSL